MNTMAAGLNRRFYRDADRAILGGVCAGLAGYLGFNLKMTRFLAFIAFLMAMPIAVVAYLAAVFLIPSASGRGFDVATERHVSRREKRRKRRREKEITEPTGPSAADIVNRSCQSLDERLIRLERHVTSRRFQLDQELSKL